MRKKLTLLICVLFAASLSGTALMAQTGTVAQEEAAGARCDARRMNDPELKVAMANIDSDIEEAEQVTEEAGNNEAVSMVADAKAKVADAKVAYNKGKYCSAYDLLTDAYGDLADGYASNARAFAETANAPEAVSAASDAELYAVTSHINDLGCAAAACRNAKINAEMARDADRMAKGRDATIQDPTFADALAEEVLAMAEKANCKPAVVDAKDAADKAYRGNIGECYAACASSLAKSAQVFADNTEASSDAKAAVDLARKCADEAATAARMGDVAGAYYAAKKAQEAAGSVLGRETANRQEVKSDENIPDAKTAPIDRASLESYLSDIGSTVHFDFKRSDFKFDKKTDLAIRALCRAMMADHNVRILITGHTDNIGSDRSNMALGRRRAEAFKAHMVSMGAPAECISTASKGEREPVVDNDTEEHRRQNRRAVITLL